MRGEFWLADTPSVRVPGTLDIPAGLLTLVNEDELVECMVVVSQNQYSLTRTFRDDTEVTYPLLGVLEDDTLVSIPDATRGRCDHYGDRTEQQFHLLVALTGHHVEDDRTQVYVAAIVSLPSAWGPVVASAPWDGTLILPTDESIEIQISHGSLHFQFPAMTRRDVERRIIEPFRALLTLLSASPDLPIAVRLIDSASEEVVHVQVERPKQGPAPTKRPALALALHQISLPNLEGWYRLTRQVAPLTTVVAKAVTASNVNIETRVLNLAAAAESFHRELYNERVLTKSQAKEIRRAAVAAVPELAKERVEIALAHIGEATFAERLGQLLEGLGPWADDLAGPRIDREKGSGRRGRDLWIKSVKDARNGTAHLLPHYAEDVVKYGSELYVLFESLRWLMTALVMQRIGVPISEVKSTAEGTSSYHLFRGRAGLYWPGIYLPQSVATPD
jgi:hypothetical protein